MDIEMLRQGEVGGEGGVYSISRGAVHLRKEGGGGGGEASKTEGTRRAGPPLICLHFTPGNPLGPTYPVPILSPHTPTYPHTHTGMHHRPTRGQILGQNPDKGLQSFPPCYSQLTLQLCLRLLFHQTHATSYSFCKGERRKT
jgi:hypothetical protein